MDDVLDMTPQERAAVVAWRLAQGAELTTQDIADATGLTIRRARGLANELSRVIPIHCIDGYWQHAMLARNGGIFG